MQGFLEFKLFHSVWAAGWESSGIQGNALNINVKIQLNVTTTPKLVLEKSKWHMEGPEELIFPQQNFNFFLLYTTIHTVLNFNM